MLHTIGINTGKIQRIVLLEMFLSYLFGTIISFWCPILLQKNILSQISAYWKLSLSVSVTNIWSFLFGFNGYKWNCVVLCVEKVENCIKCTCFVVAVNNKIILVSPIIESPQKFSLKPNL